MQPPHLAQTGIIIGIIWVDLEKLHAKNSFRPPISNF